MKIRTFQKKQSNEEDSRILPDIGLRTYIVSN